MMQTSQSAKASHQISNASCLLALSSAQPRMRREDALPSNVFRYCLSALFRLRLIILPYFPFIK